MSCTCETFAARARNRVSIEQLTTLADDMGGRTDNWDLLAQVWAVIEPTSGKEVFINGQLQSRVDAKVTIRYLSDICDTRIASKARLTFENRVYNISAIRNLASDMKTEGKVFQQLFCVEAEPS
jgi:SPP1 family predicted phage head-tail adaptor